MTLEVVKNLRKAADLIEIPGKFIRGTQDDGKGRYCALGAIGRAKGGRYGYDNDPEVKALALMCPEPDKMPKDTYNFGSHNGASRVVARFNNMVARDGADVACRMRAAADWVEASDGEVLNGVE